MDEDVGAYFEHGITLAPGDTVLDLGANIGLFALRARQRQPDLALYCVEPVPRLRALLAQNLGDAVTIVPCAIGAEPGTVELEYLPLISGQSGVIGVIPDVDRWVDFMRTSYGRFARWVPRPLFALPARFWRAGRKRFTCEQRTISQLIDEFELHDVALLKLDIEGCELPALRGIRDEHWPRVRQIAGEVHDRTRDMPALRELLERHGFRVIVGELTCPDRDCCTMYALRS